MNAGELDGLIIAEDTRHDFTQAVIQICKLYEIPRVGVMDLQLPNPASPIYWLDNSKAYISYLNTNVAYGCNLNRKGCTHFAGLFGRDEIYPFEYFRRDIRRLSQICDVVTFRLLGGEPLLNKELDKYIEVTRQYFPKSNLGIVTNGMLLPSISKRLVDALRENNFVVYVSLYPPTLKILKYITKLLDDNKVLFSCTEPIRIFRVFLTLHDGNDPEKSRKCCSGNYCKFLHDGKIYKCPSDALSYRFTEKFGLKNFPAATGVDLYAPNFSAELVMLNGSVEMCNWCSERPARQIPWKPTNNPQLEDWLADPAELQYF